MPPRVYCNLIVSLSSSEIISILEEKEELNKK
jgi:hypothetical protein